MEDKHSARRHELFQESLKNANTPRYGYFGYTAGLAIGDDSLAPKRNVKTDVNKPNCAANPTKCGQTTESYFSVSPPLCIGDQFVDPGKRAVTKRRKLPEGQPEFKPNGIIHRSTNTLGYLYQIRGASDATARKEDVKPRNIYCNPLKKGSSGSLTNGTLFGFGEERKSVPEFVPDDYNSGAKIARENRLKERALMPDVPFRGPGALKLGLIN